MSQEKQQKVEKSDDEDPKEIFDSDAHDEHESEEGEEALDPMSFKQKYPLDHIKRMVDVKMTQLDSDHLESQAEVVNLFTQIYIVQDYSYYDRIDSLYIQIMDPFYRQRVRDHNRNTDPLAETYFSGSEASFDLTNFIFSLLNKYAASGQLNFGEISIAESALMLLVETLELGLWNFEQTDKLMETLFERAENLHKVEENVKRDGEILPEKTARQMLSCKENIATCLLQLIIFHNDWWFVITCKNINDKIPKKRDHASTNPKKETAAISIEKLKPFQETFKVYERWSLIIFNYLFYNVEFEENILLTDSYRTTMHHILMMIYDTRLDPFIISLDLIKRDYLLFYFLESIPDVYMNMADGVQKKLNELFEMSMDTISRNDVEKPILKILEKLEYLLSLQDEKLSTKLMVTERAFPLRILKMMKLISTVLTSDSVMELAHELILRSFRALAHILTGNYPAQAMILKDQCFNLLSDIFECYPIEAATFMSEILEKDTRIIRYSTLIYDRFVKKYQEVVDQFFNNFESERQISMKQLVIIFAYNKLFDAAINACGKDRHEQPFDIAISNLLQPHICENVLPYFSKNKRTIHETYNPKLLAKSWTLENCYSLVSISQLGGEIDESMIMDVYWSILKLFTLSSNRVFNSSFLPEVRSLFTMKFDEFDYMLKFPDGQAFRSEILRCFSLFNIFPRNSSYGLKGTNEAPDVTDGGKFVKKKAVKEKGVEEDIIPKNHCREVPGMILTELKRFNNATTNLFKQNDFIKYVFTSFLPMIYKYINGMKHFSYTYADEKGLKNAEEILPLILEQIKTLKNRIAKFIPNNQEMLGKADRKSIIPGGPVVDNEKLVEICNETLDLIYSMVLGTRFHNIFSMLVRRKRFYHYLHLDHVCSHLETSVMFLCESGLQTPNFTDKEAGKQKTAPGIVLQKMNEYKSMKWKYLRKPFDSTFFQVLTSKLEETNQKNMVSFQIEITIGFDLSFGTRNHYLCNPDFLSLINFFANMIYWSKRSRKFSFQYLAKNPHKRDYYFSIYFRALKELGIYVTMKPYQDSSWEEMWSRFYIVNNFYRAFIGNNNGKFKNFFADFIPMPIEKLLDKEYGGFTKSIGGNSMEASKVQTGKTGRENQQSSRNSVVEGIELDKSPIKRMKSNLKDLCSMTDCAFNILTSHLNSTNQTGNKNPFAIEYYYQLDRAINMTALNKNKERKINTSDRSELFPMIIMMVKTLKDLTNGASLKNQELVYQLGIDIFMNTVLRLIDDITDDFYHLKSEVLHFFLGQLEGGNKDIMNYISYNVEINLMYAQSVTLVRKCWCIEAKKADIINSLPRQDQEAKKQEWRTQLTIVKGGEKKVPESGIKIEPIAAKKVAISNVMAVLASALVDDFNEKFTISTKDESRFYLKKWEELIEMYGQNETFSDSVPLQCANRLFAFIYKLAFDMQKYQIFLDNKERELKDCIKEKGFSFSELENRKYEMIGKTTSNEDLQILYFMKEINILVEILTKKNTNEVMMFTKLPSTFFLSSTSMEKFTEVCPIDNTESKCTAMMGNINQFQIEMNFNQQYKKTYPTILEMTSDRYFTMYRISNYAISIVINSINFIAVKEDRHVAQGYTGGSAVDNLVGTLNVWMAIYGWCITSLWFVTRFPQIKLIEIDKYYVANAIDYLNFFPWAKIFFINSILLQPEVISFFCHGFLGFMSSSLGPIFTALNLLMIINISSTVKYVLSSVTRHFGQVVMTFFMAAVFVWVYAMIVADYYVEAFEWDGGIVGQVKLCSSYYKCFMYIFNIGIRSGGGIAEIMEIGSTTKQDFWGRFFFDMTFWILINIFCQNIIIGIIVDTFSELRSLLETREYEQNNKCFICGIDRKTFDKKGVNFNLHQAYSHNLWDYVYFLISMAAIEKHKSTGYEFYVNSRFQKKHTTWIPINRTIYLSSDDQKKDKFGKQEKTLKMMQDHIFDYIDKKFDELADSLNDKLSQAGV